MKISPNGRSIAPIDPGLLEHIPGLGIKGNAAFGSVDAVQIAAIRHGAPIAVAMAGQPAFVDTGRTYNPLLRQYQNEGVAWLASKLKKEGGAILGDDPGLGKTVQTIKTWEALGKPTPLLVVCPASVRRTWRAQFARWAPDTKPLLVESGKHLEQMERATPVVITGYELAQRLPLTFAPNMLVLDEAHRLRGRSAKQAKAFWEMAKLANYRLALTGSPLWDRPRDLWCLLKTLFNYRFGTAEAFDYAYCGAHINAYGGRENKGATRSDELALRLQHVLLRRTKVDVKEQMPALTVDTVWIDPTREATTFMRRAALKQCSFMDALKATLVAKIKPAVEAAMEVPNCIISCWRKCDVDDIATALAESRGRPVLTITGEESHAAREATVTEAAEKHLDVVFTIASAGLGVDGLQHVTSYGIFHALSYLPEEMKQAIARLHRGGQTLPVSWRCMAMRDSADEYVVSTVIEKLHQQTQLIQGDGKLLDAIEQKSTADADAAALAAIYEAMELE